DRRLDRERAAALHRNADVRVLAMNDSNELFPHLGRHGVEVGVPRSPVAQHRHLRGERRRDGAGREEDRIARKEAHRCLGIAVLRRMPFCRLLTIYTDAGPMRKMQKSPSAGGNGGARPSPRKPPARATAKSASSSPGGADAIALV